MDVSDIFYFFSSGEGKGESGATGRGRGSAFFIENPRRGGGGGEGAATVSARNFGGGGGLNIFFRGRNARQVGMWLIYWLSLHRPSGHEIEYSIF